MVRKVLSVLLVIFWMGFIFSFSNTKGDASSSFSEELLIKIIEVVTPYEKGSEEMEKLVDKLHFPFRKLAHFTIYFILGVLVINAFLAFNMPKYSIIYAVLICILYAISDEVHQLYVNDRKGNLGDVLLDSSGSCLSIYLISRFYILRGKNEKAFNK